MQKFLEGVTKLMFLICKDYKNFVCYYYFDFINALPDRCKQLRNMILSVHPINHAIPLTPFDDEVRVDQIKEMKQYPEIWSDFESITNAFPTLKQDIKSGNSKNIVKLIESYQDTFMDPKTKNMKLIHALILTISKDISQVEVSKLQMKSKESELLREIAMQLKPEMLMVYLNCIFNELRYANKLTLFFIFVLTKIFALSQNEQVEEAIAMILLERMVNSKPHPFGLILLFRELIQNRDFKFFEKQFVVRSEEVRRVFEDLHAKIKESNKKAKKAPAQFVSRR